MMIFIMLFVDKYYFSPDEKLGIIVKSVMSEIKKTAFSCLFSNLKIKTDQSNFAFNTFAGTVFFQRSRKTGK